jgi:hypothetical protein
MVLILPPLSHRKPSLWYPFQIAAEPRSELDLVMTQLNPIKVKERMGEDSVAFGEYSKIKLKKNNSKTV